MCRVPVGCGATFTVVWPLTVPAVTVTVVLPWATPCSIPLPDTVASAPFADCQPSDTPVSTVPAESFTVALSWSESVR